MREVETCRQTAQKKAAVLEERSLLTLLCYCPIADSLPSCQVQVTPCRRSDCRLLPARSVWAEISLACQEGYLQRLRVGPSPLEKSASEHYLIRNTAVSVELTRPSEGTYHVDKLFHVEHWSSKGKCSEGTTTGSNVCSCTKPGPELLLGPTKRATKSCPQAAQCSVRAQLMGLKSARQEGGQAPPLAKSSAKTMAASANGEQRPLK
jgi:hypothetical protein